MERVSSRPVGSSPDPELLLESVARSRDDWADLVRFDPGRRWRTRVGLDPSHDIWLLSWLPGQKTELHDHGQTSGAFVILWGALTELTIRGRGRSPETEWVRWTEQETRRFGPHLVHQLRNDTTEPAVSLHAYVPAMTSMARHAWTATQLGSSGEA